jgi:DNA-binding NtrC family response regulator
MRDGAVDFLVKPIDLIELRTTLSRIFEDRAMRRGGDRSRQEVSQRPEVPTLVGRDLGMIAVFKLVGQAAATPSTVLIRGESGTGKEIIARAIHSNSSRKSEPFVAVNCAAIPDALLESELFGHVRGGFTGAVADRRGRFAMAGKGTVFLDEVGDTSADVQAKLLRVLQEGEFYPVGAERPQRSTARVLAATHQDLEELIERGEFREDLYYRLRVVEINVPPLRERKNDIPVLADHLLARASHRLQRPLPVLAPDSLALLLARDWPGNVRELENCLERALVVASGEVIRPEHLRTESRTRVESETLSLEAAEREHLKHVLTIMNGNKSRTAMALEISRPRLDRLLRKYSLEGVVQRRGGLADE